MFVGTAEGRVIVQSFDLAGFLNPFFKSIKDIKKIHHFTFEEQSLRGGDLLIQATCTETPQSVRFLRDTSISLPSSMPPVIPPKGLTADRQWYLYDRIREFCPDNCKDKACPKPSMPKPAAAARNIPEAPQGSSSDEFSPPQKRRKTTTRN